MKDSIREINEIPELTMGCRGHLVLLPLSENH